jgi:uncharacterized protein (DUF1800 family)
LGAQKQFTVSTSIQPAPAVSWYVNSIAGGNAQSGTISATGLYTAPALLPAVNTVTVEARLATNPVQKATATVTLQNPKPSISSFTPSAANVGEVKTIINGTGFIASSKVDFGGVPAKVQVLSSTQISVETVIANPIQLTVVVKNPDPGAYDSNSRTFNVMPPVSVNVTPDTTSIRALAGKKFYASVTNATDKTVNWFINGIAGGNATVGTIDATGQYTAPAAIPAGGTVTVEARSVLNAAALDKSIATILNPIPVLSTFVPAALPLGPSVTFTINGTGFVTGSTVKVNGKVVTTQFISPVKLQATGEVPAAPGGIALLSVSNPDPGAANSAVSLVKAEVANPKVSYRTAVRFLEQATWGPSPQEIVHLQEVGIDAWLEEQRTAPVSLYTVPTNKGTELATNQIDFFKQVMSGTDQLRQRVAFALLQTCVVSGLELTKAYQLAPYLNMLRNNAFSPYKTVMREVTLSPAMGVYLNMVNNFKPDPAKGTFPNENYAREWMQLFSLGTTALALDGTAVPGAQPTYGQTDVQQLALALTGWTYPGPSVTKANPPRFDGPMVPIETQHDQTQKTVLGKTIPPGLDATRELDAALEIIANHPNLAPFISFRMIQHLVTSNPSPAYVLRVSKTFLEYRGDLFQVVKAILKDSEARQGDTPGAADLATGGHLREPVVLLMALTRALEGTIRYPDPMEEYTANMGQNLLYPNSVFNYFSPLYRTGGAGNPMGPEFQILTPTTALERVNIINSFLRNNLNGDVLVNMTWYKSLASQPEALLDVINNYFLHGAMPLKMRDSILSATQGMSTDETARTALYLALSSNQYQVQH